MRPVSRRSREERRVRGARPAARRALVLVPLVLVARLGPPGYAEFGVYVRGNEGRRG